MIYSLLQNTKELQCLTLAFLFSLLWAIHLGPNHDEMPNVAKSLYQSNDAKSQESGRSTGSCFSLVCCILIAYTIDKAFAIECIEKIEERKGPVHPSPESSKEFVKDAVQMLLHQPSILRKHRLDCWDVIEARSIRYSYLQSHEFVQTNNLVPTLHYANALTATYDLIKERDITLQLTKFHSNGFVGFLARKTKSVRATVYKVLQG